MIISQAQSHKAITIHPIKVLIQPCIKKWVHIRLSLLNKSQTKICKEKKVIATLLDKLRVEATHSKIKVEAEGLSWAVKSVKKSLVSLNTTLFLAAANTR